MCTTKQPNYFQINKSRSFKMDPLEKVGQEVLQVPEGYNATKLLRELNTNNGTEKVAEKSLMEEIGDTLAQEEPREPEMVEVDRAKYFS